MAAPARVDVHGYPELEDGSRRLFANIDEEAPKAFLGVAGEVASEVESIVPRLSGTLAGSVAAKPKRGKKRGANVGMGSGGVPYAGWIEFGGGHGRPFIAEGRYLFPTGLDADEQIVDAALEVANDEIRKMRWPSPT